MSGVIKKILAACITAVIALSGMSYVMARPVSADIDYSDYYADYTEINYISCKGNPITLYVDGGTIGVTSNCITEGKIAVRKERSFGSVASQTGSNSFTLNASSKMTPGTLYKLELSYKADGLETVHDGLFIMLTSEGNITFIKSLVYDYNLERTSEWWTDEKSLEECLQPQNDIECDNPVVVSYAKAITKDCTTDWEKAYAIYEFVLTFAYDDVQVEDKSMVYQDDVLTLIRRKIAICEGIGNTFVALCRAADIPAVVCFGIGSVDQEMVYSEDMITNEKPNHAWAAVCLDGHWYSVDPTWDMSYYYEGDSFDKGEWECYPCTTDWYLLPLEDFSMSHKICDADTVHGIESEGSCGETSSYKITRDGTITFYGTGEIKLPDGVNGFSKVVFDPDSRITSIGEQCFYDCDLITTVILPSSVTRIENFAFNTCEDLEYIYIPEGVTYIGQEAFDYCDELAYVRIPDSIFKMERYAFDDCPRAIIDIPARMEGFASDYYVDPGKIIYR